jgi:CheY-like chemotaxis protein
MATTVLLVEDEPLLQEVTSEDLHDLGFVTVCARDGDEALGYLESELPLAAMVTDIRMPGNYDGWTLARRARELRPELPVIYLSGYSEDGLQPVPNGVFVRKPYRFNDIEAAFVQLGLK